jgi:ribosomal protein L31E
MAEKKAETTLERVYNIPLRSVWVKSPRVMRANSSVSAIRAFVERHTKAKEVKVSQNVNSLVWGSGAKKPPGMITVKVKVSDGIAHVRLPGEITLEEEKKKFLDEKKGGKKEEKATDASHATEEKEEPAAAEKAEEKAPAKEDKAEAKPKAAKKPAAKKEKTEKK